MLTQDKFDELVKKAEADTCYSSRTQDLIEHPAYQEVITYGNEALPFLFARMITIPCWWFEALRQITGASPEKYEHRGYLPKLTNDWLEWARKNDY